MTDRGVPRFVKVIAVGMAVMLVLVLGAAWQISDIRKDEEQRDCQRAIEGRADNRAMWEYVLFQEVPREGNLSEQEQAEVDRFTQALNRLLPELECVNADPTPIAEE